MTQKSTLFLVDDNSQFRIGLKIFLQTFDHLSICGEASDGEEAVSLICHEKPDITIVDLSMPKVDGVELIKRLSKANVSTRIIVLSQHITVDWLTKLIENEIDGYILKSDGREFLKNAIDAVQTGEKYFSPTVAKTFYQMLTAQRTLPIARPKDHALSPKEREVAILTSKGLTVKEIALSLNCSENTVKTHKSNLMRKIDARNAAEVSFWVYQNLD